jgi:hypothetical protein
MSRSYPKSYHHDCLVVNDTALDIWTNRTVLPSFQNCSRGIYLGNEIFVHVCWYQKEVVVDIRKFDENIPQLLGIGLKKKNWYDIVHEMRNITNLVRDIEFNHTIFGYNDWLTMDEIFVMKRTTVRKTLGCLEFLDLYSNLDKVLEG